MNYTLLIFKFQGLIGQIILVVLDINGHRENTLKALNYSRAEILLKIFIYGVTNLSKYYNIIINNFIGRHNFI